MFQRSNSLIKYIYIAVCQICCCCTTRGRTFS